MPSGTIKWFSPVKGYGFISVGEGEEDVFLHASQLAAGEDRHLFPGDRVIFEEVRGEKGPKAVSVRRSPEASAESPDATSDTGAPPGDVEETETVAGEEE